MNDFIKEPRYPELLLRWATAIRKAHQLGRYSGWSIRAKV